MNNLPPNPFATSNEGESDTFFSIKKRVEARITSDLVNAASMSHDDAHRFVEERFDTALNAESTVLSRAERTSLFNVIVAEVLGFGPLEPYLSDPAVMEIMVNSFKHIYVERHGKLEKVQSTFEDNDHLMRIIERIATPLGQKVDESHPIVDVRLADGSRVHIVIPPISLIGPTMVIRRFTSQPYTGENLIAFGAMTAEILEFLRACILGRMTIVVAGGTGSGKTTLHNIICTYIPDDERIITVESAAELILMQPHVIPLESRPPNLEGRGEITLRQLVESAMKMRPDRIILNDARGGEVFAFLQAVNTGHDGAMINIHAISPRDALVRLELMATEGNPSVPLLGIREQIASGIDVIVQMERLQDGLRRITSITEVKGMENGIVATEEIFKFERTGYQNGKVEGYFTATGRIPHFMDRIEAWDVQLSPSIFEPARGQ